MTQHFNCIILYFTKYAQDKVI